MYPEQMTVIEINQHGGPEVLQAAQRPVPQPATHEVLIEVAVAGVNRPDCLQRAGQYAPPPDASDLPGLEVAGRVVASGAEVRQWQVGDAVCALTHGGGYAEYCCAPANHCLPVPAGFTLAQAAALPENYFTVWSNVFERGGLQPGETLLVHGGAGGIGTTAIQLGKALGATVIATAGHARKTAFCQDIGADLAINYREEDFVPAVKTFTQGRGADVILDMVGGDYVARNLKALAVDGRLVLIAFLRGPKVELNLAPLMVKRQTITGSTLRPQSLAAKAAIAESLYETVWPLLETGQVKPIIDRSFPLHEAVAAHQVMEANENIGKLLLIVKNEPSEH